MKKMTISSVVILGLLSSAPAYSGQGVACVSLVVIDGDTIKCDGQNMRLLGGGVPFKSGVDAPEMGSRAKCVCDETGAATYKRYRPNEKPPFQPASYEDVAPPKFQGVVSVVGRVRRSIINM